MSDADLTIALRGVVKRFGDQYAVKRLDLDIAKGSFFSILGPSGCGKTTTLRMIAGFEQPDEGHILLEGQPVEDVPPYRRNVNTVFQSYALFEHLSLFENIAFGLRRKKVAKPEITRRVGEMLELVRLADRAKAKPRQLSGGQRQRVALARALVNLPAVLLLDEPLGALDLQLRKTMQLELKHIQREVGITFVYVTHDQEEALTMSDSIAVMNLGELQQVGNAEDVYERPANSFVAQFIGISNLLDATAERDGVKLTSGVTLPAKVPAEITAGSSVCLSIRPEKLALGPAADGRVSVEGTIVESVYMGTVTHYVIEIAPGARMIVDLPEHRGCERRQPPRRGLPRHALVARRARARARVLAATWSGVTAGSTVDHPNGAAGSGTTYEKPPPVARAGRTWQTGDPASPCVLPQLRMVPVRGSIATIVWPASCPRMATRARCCWSSARWTVSIATMHHAGTPFVDDAVRPTDCSSARGDSVPGFANVSTRAAQHATAATPPRIRAGRADPPGRPQAACEGSRRAEAIDCLELGIVLAESPCASLGGQVAKVVADLRDDAPAMLPVAFHGARELGEERVDRTVVTSRLRARRSCRAKTRPTPRARSRAQPRRRVSARRRAASGRSPVTSRSRACRRARDGEGPGRPCPP